MPPGSGARIGVDRDDDGYLRPRRARRRQPIRPIPATIPRDADADADADRDADADADRSRRRRRRRPPTASPTPTPTRPDAAPTADRDPDRNADADSRPDADADRTVTATATPTVTGIRNSKLVLKDDVLPPISADGRSLRFTSSSYQGVPGGAYSPAFGTTGDPTVLGASGGGAVLTVYHPGGTEKVVVALPASAWTRIGTNVSPGYKYRDAKRVLGPISQVSLKSGKLSLSGKGTGLLGLASAPHRSIAVRLRLGNGVEFCAVGPAKAPVTSNDTTAKFVSAANAAAPTSCPPVP